MLFCTAWVELFSAALRMIFHQTSSSDLSCDFLHDRWDAGFAVSLEFRTQILLWDPEQVTQPYWASFSYLSQGDDNCTSFVVFWLIGTMGVKGHLRSSISEKLNSFGVPCFVFCFTRVLFIQGRTNFTKNKWLSSP